MFCLCYINHFVSTSMRLCSRGGFCEELQLVFIGSINLKGVPLSSNNILGVLAVCIHLHKQAGERVRRLKLVRHICPCSCQLWSFFVCFVMYPSITWLSTEMASRHLPADTTYLGSPPTFYLSANGNSIRTKFDGLEFFFFCVCACLTILGDVTLDIPLISLQPTCPAHEQIQHFPKVWRYHVYTA